eukprot:1299220-Amphidinium_carterae.2
MEVELLVELLDVRGAALVPLLVLSAVIIARDRRKSQREVLPGFRVEATCRGLQSIFFCYKQHREGKPSHRRSVSQSSVDDVRPILACVTTLPSHRVCSQVTHHGCCMAVSFHKTQSEG